MFCRVVRFAHIIFKTAEAADKNYTLLLSQKIGGQKVKVDYIGEQRKNKVVQPTARSAPGERTSQTRTNGITQPATRYVCSLQYSFINQNLG